MTYVIVDGVRRAKAASLLGWNTIPCVLRGDPTGSSIQIPLSELRSKRLTIEVSTPRKAERFHDVFHAMQSGRVVPPLVVTRGSRGIPVADIQFDLTGDL